MVGGALHLVRRQSQELGSPVREAEGQVRAAAVVGARAASHDAAHEIGHGGLHPREHSTPAGGGSGSAGTAAQGGERGAPAGSAPAAAAAAAATPSAPAALPQWGSPGRAEPGGGTAGSGAAARPRAHRSSGGGGGGGRFPPPGAALGELSPAAAAAAAAESCDSEAGFARALPAPPAAPAGSWHTPGTGGRRPRPPPAPGKGEGERGGGDGRTEGPRQVRGGRGLGGAAPGCLQRCGGGPGPAERRAVLTAATCGKSCRGDVSRGVARGVSARWGGSVTGGREVVAGGASVPAAPGAEPKRDAPSPAPGGAPWCGGTRLPLEGFAILPPLKRVKSIFFLQNNLLFKKKKKNYKYPRREGGPAAVAHNEPRGSCLPASQ